MATLTFSTTHSGCSAAKSLEISIAGACSKLMQIELQVPKAIASAALAAQAKAASHNSRGIPAKANRLIKRSDTDWKAWVQEGSDGVILLQLTNFRDADYDFISSADKNFGKIVAGTPLTVTLPLNTALKAQTQVDLKYSYGGKKHGHRVIFGGHFITEGSLDKLCFLPAGGSSTAAETVEVAFTTNHASDQTALAIGTEVELKWEIKDGISGKIVGPLAEGLSEMSLDFSNADKSGISKGSFTVRAVGQQTYLLDVTVKGKPDNVDVLRTLILDVQSAANYGAIWVDKPRVFLGESVNVHWAAWGVDMAAIDVKPANGSETTHTVLRKTSTPATGQGFISQKIDAPGKTDLMLQLSVNGTPQYLDANPDVQVVQWESAAKSLGGASGDALAMAFAADGSNGVLAIMYQKTIVFAPDAGAEDPTVDILPPLHFSVKADISVPGGEWMALVSIGDGFVALRRQNRIFDLVHFNVHGSQIAATPLPEWFSFCPLLQNKNNYVRFWGKLLAYKKQVIVFGGCHEEPDWTPTPISINYGNLKPAGSSYPSPKIEMLERLNAFRGCDEIVVAGDKLLGIDYQHRMVLCTSFYLQTVEKEKYQYTTLDYVGSFQKIADIPEKQASALSNAVPLVVGDLLLLLNCGSGPNKRHWVWSPKTNKWAPVSLGLDVSNGVIAYRPGNSPRLWAANCKPLGATDSDPLHTFALLGAESFFVADYFKDNPAVPYNWLGFGGNQLTTGLSNLTTLYLSAHLGYLNTKAEHNVLCSTPGCWLSGLAVSNNGMQPYDVYGTHTEAPLWTQPVLTPKAVRLKRMWMVAKDGTFPQKWVTFNGNRLVAIVDRTMENGRPQKTNTAIFELTPDGQFFKSGPQTGYRVYENPQYHWIYFDIAPIKISITNSTSYEISSSDWQLNAIQPGGSGQISFEYDKVFSEHGGGGPYYQGQIWFSNSHGNAGAFWLSLKIDEAPGIEQLNYANGAEMMNHQTKMLAVSIKDSHLYTYFKPAPTLKFTLVKKELAEGDYCVYSITLEDG